MRAATLPSAANGASPATRSALKRTLTWIPKSTPSPTNRGMNATEIRLKVWTASNPVAAVRISPTAVVATIASTVFAERVANHKAISNAATMIAPTSPIFSCSEPNSSSDSGTSPVTPTATPWPASRCCAAAWAWTAATASSPGWRLLKSSLGCTVMIWRNGGPEPPLLPENRVCHEKNAGFPAVAAVTASAIRRNAGSSLSSAAPLA